MEFDTWESRKISRYSFYNFEYVIELINATAIHWYPAKFEDVQNVLLFNQRCACIAPSGRLRPVDTRILT